MSCLCSGHYGKAYTLSFSSRYWIATRPSTLLIAYPFAAGKHAIHRVCHFSGDIVIFPHDLESLRMTRQANMHLVDSLWSLQIEDGDMSFGCADDHEGVGDV